MAQYFRNIVNERDQSEYANPTLNLKFGAAAVTEKGVKCTCYSPDDVITYLGTPSAKYPALFDIITMTKLAPVIVNPAIGANAKFGGIDITKLGATSWGMGRLDNFNFNAIQTARTQNIGTGTGITKTYTGTLSNVPISDGYLKIQLGSRILNINLTTGVITGDATGTLNLTTGVYNIVFNGNVGTVAEYQGNVDLSAGLDLSTFPSNKVKVTIDTVTQDVEFGNSATTTLTNIVSAINTAFGATVASHDSTYLSLTGLIGSVLSGKIRLAAPSSGNNVLSLIFGALLQETTASTSPTQAVPNYGESIDVTYTQLVDKTTEVAFSIMTLSPYQDDLAAIVTYKGGQKFNLALKKKNKKTAGYGDVGDWNFSLIQETELGKSLYYEDVFKYNKYIQIVLNTAYNDTFAFTATPETLFAGGSRGDTPTDGDITSAWDIFYQDVSNEVNLLVDPMCKGANKINDIIMNAQNYAHGISVVPFGQGAKDDAIAFRQNLSLDTDHISLYSNHRKIKDEYNDSYAWISNAGAIAYNWGKSILQSFGALSCAGTKENGIGGILEDGYVYVEQEVEYSKNDLFELNNYQINPFVKDPIYGFMADGDNTLKVTPSDTLQTGTRLLYNYIIKNILTKVMKKQTFKLNDRKHRQDVTNGINTILRDPLTLGYLSYAECICNESNNTAEILNQRKFVIEVKVRVTPNSQVVILNFTRLPQGEIKVS